MNKSNNCIKLELIKFIKERDWVSFVEIEDFLEGKGMKLKGDYYYGIPSMNIAYWINMTEDFVDMIEELLESKKIFIYPSEWLVYLADGCCLKLPLVKNIPSKGYRKLHWQPICFRTVPHNK